MVERSSLTFVKDAFKGEIVEIVGKSKAARAIRIHACSGMDPVPLCALSMLITRGRRSSCWQSPN